MTEILAAVLGAMLASTFAWLLQRDLFKRQEKSSDEQVRKQQEFQERMQKDQQDFQKRMQQEQQKFQHEQFCADIIARTEAAQYQRGVDAQKEMDRRNFESNLSRGIR